MVDLSDTTDKPITPAFAWQPLTPRGVAAFSRGSFTRLALVQSAAAGLVAIAVLWFLSVQWFPVVTEAIHELPPGSVIRGGRLTTSNAMPTVLAGNRTLEIVFDPLDAGGLGGSADVSVVLAGNQLRVASLAGHAALPYLRGYRIDLDRNELDPWWGAWRKAVAALAVVATILALLALWWALGTVASPLVWILAFFADKQLSLFASWRLACAALMPGALLLATGLALYGLGAIDLLRLGLFVALHFVCGLAFLCTSPFFIPPVPGTTRAKNPFNTATSKDGPQPKPAAKPVNPFK
jgi:hypothetical protein